MALHSAGIYGNQGIQDILLGLDWVQKEISGFGGDPVYEKKTKLEDQELTIYLSYRTKWFSPDNQRVRRTYILLPLFPKRHLYLKVPSRNRSLYLLSCQIQHYKRLARHTHKLSGAVFMT
jgi:hypothetical protein